MTEPWTCPCGHELDRHDRDVCLVWDARNRNLEHRIHTNSNTCECHGRTIQDIERWEKP